MKYIILLSLVILVGCQKDNYDIALQEVEQELGWLNHADPSESFEKALKNKDFRFLGIGGHHTILTPGVNKSCLNKKDIIVIKGTEGGVIGYEHAKLIAIAETFAKYYNLRMKIYLEENDKFNCKT